MRSRVIFRDVDGASMVLAVSRFFITWAVCVCVLLEEDGTAADVHLGVLLPVSGAWPVGKTIRGAALLAARDVNSDPALLASHTLTLSLHDTGCNQGKGLLQLVQMLSRTSVHGVIGGGCDEVCEPVGLMLAEYRLPVVSWGCTSPKLSRKVQYPTLARTVAAVSSTIWTFRATLKHFGWSRVSILSTSDGLWQYVTQALKTELEIYMGGLVVDMHTFAVESYPNMSAADRGHRREQLEHAMLHSRVLVLCAYGDDARGLMLDALDLGLVKQGYAFITLNLHKDSMYGRNTWMGEDGRDEDAKRAFTGLLNIQLHKPSTREYRTFEDKVRQINSQTDSSHPSTGSAYEIDVHAAMLHDAILLYAHALNEALIENDNVFDGVKVARKLFNRTIEGVLGRVSIDEHGDASPKQTVENFQDGRFVEFAESMSVGDELVQKPGVQLVFSGGGLEAPRDYPPCGWNRELCPDTIVTTVLSACVSVVVLLLAVILGGGFYYRRMKSEAQLTSEDMWRIQLNELQSASSNKKQCASIISTKSLFVCGDHVGGTEWGVKTALHKGRVVAVKEANRKQVIVDRKLLQELKHVMLLQHENINPFVGLCITPGTVYVISVYCSRGSLQDILANLDIKITPDFSLSFIIDICKGMEYLCTSSLGCHGRLTSSNCVIDNRWICKIADAGMRSLRAADTEEDAAQDSGDQKQYSALLWTAPELLRRPLPPGHGTRQADVYAYGIILQEIILRSEPYSMVDGKESKEIVELVARGCHTPFRPLVPHGACEPYLHQLMETCWKEEPAARPDFSRIRRRLRDENTGKQLNILDNLLKMMEQYADHLEELVSERTKQLEEEQKKTDQLLYQMLPRPVAESLKMGADVDPEAFARVTVYFSDIVGFTKLASESTPFQVVDFLNDLYRTFDAVIDNYDVYKVETIGDAYMVVSGLPVPNGDRHAGEIASMSLDILHNVGKFRIRHLRHTQLQTRIGIHTGPVVAGVVGLKMPRYCLFGDTVNTASRMESSGLALRIHLSKSTHDVLVILGSYIMEERGEIQIKGKGAVQTFWLSGQRGFNKPLPDVTKAASAGEHEFK